MKASQAPAGNRYLAIDSMRGIAALSVAVFHLALPSFAGVDSSLIAGLGKTLSYGYLGVAIFFVISGFVIASTINTADVSFGFLGKYIVKRVIRLDPPYWLSIFLDLMLIWLGIHFLGLTQELPSPQKVLAHLVYLQDILGYGGISAIYWTLCMEVQFYIFFSLVFAVANFSFGAKWRQYSHLFVGFVFCSTAMTSLLIAAGYVKNPFEGSFLPLWHLFVTGALCYWVASKRVLKEGWFYTMIVALVVLLVLQVAQGRPAAYTSIVALVTSGFIYVAASRQKLSTWLCWRPLLYLGGISYSLYLFHGIIGERFISFTRQWLYPRLGREQFYTADALLLFAGGVVVSVVFAHCVFALVERPAMNISKKIRPGSKIPLLKQLADHE